VHLEPDVLIHGVSPPILLDMALQLHDINQSSWSESHEFSLEDIAIALGATLAEARSVTEALVADGVFARGEGHERGYFATQKLGQLANASISKGITRQRAEVLLQDVIRAAEMINADPEKYPYQVTCLVVFGSFLTDKATLGDLDIGLLLRQTVFFTGSEFGIEQRMKIDRSHYNRSRAALRLKKPKLVSLHELDEVVRIGTPYRLVFGELPNVPAAE